MNILFMGKCLPELDIESLQNIKIAQWLKNGQKNKIFLLSESWCAVELDDYIRVGKCESLGFEKIYYVDPIQLQYTNIEIAKIGLAIKVCKMHKIDIIYVSDVQRYGQTAELMKLYFSIPTVMAFFTDRIVQKTNEIYVKTWLKEGNRKESICVTYRGYKQFVNEFCNVENFVPYILKRNKNISANDLLIMGGISVEQDLIDLKKAIENEVRKTKVKLLLWGKGKKKLIEMLDCGSKIDIVDTMKWEEITNAFDTGMRVCTIEDYFTEKLSVNQALLFLSYGLCPIVNEITWKVLKECETAQMEYEKIEDDRYVVKNVQLWENKNAEWK